MQPFVGYSLVYPALSLVPSVKGAFAFIQRALGMCRKMWLIKTVCLFLFEGFVAAQPELSGHW